MKLRRHAEIPVAPLTGGLLAVAATIILRTALGARLLAEVVVDGSTYVLQPRGFSFLLETFGHLGKSILFASVLIGETLVYVIVWELVSRFVRASATVRAGVAALASAAVFILFTAVLVAATPTDLGSDTSWPLYILVALFAGLIFATTAVMLEYQPGARRTAVVTPGGLALPQRPVDESRRRFAALVPVLLIGGAIFVIARQVLRTTHGGVQASRAPGPTPEVTPTADFYLVSKNIVDPVVDQNGWKLRIGGLTNQMLELSYADILTLPAVEEYATLQCISNDIGGDLMSNALWKGIPFKDLLNKAGVQSSAAFVSFRCRDDYTDTIPLAFAMQDGVMLAYEMNGEKLPDKHGFPVRMVSPGKYGMKHPKWITEIALMDKETLGYWQERGWDQTARMNTSTRIDVPGDGDFIGGPLYTVHGVAFAGNRGIKKVEVSTDGGSNWHDASLKPALSPYTWVLWSYDWTNLPSSGKTDIVARATDGGGDTQTSDENPPYPAGATGYPRVSVTFKVST